MAQTLGLLTFTPAINQLSVLAKPVQLLLQNWKGKILVEEILASEINPEFAGSAEFCQKYQVRSEEGANTIIVKGKRAGEVKYAACLVPVGKKLEVNHVVKKFLDVSDVSFAPMDFAVEASGMEYGSITVFGLPKEWPILIDKSLIEIPYLVVGGGARRTKLLVPGKSLTDLPNASVIENLAI